MWQTLFDNLHMVLLWSVLATAAMTTIMSGSQGLGLSRLSLPFLVGTMLTGRRSQANVIGFVLYLLGGWLFAIFYVVFFLGAGLGTWWLGLLLGLAQGLVLLVVLLPIVPYMHPRMASEYAGPTRTRRLEPPGFIGLNYGYRTPLSVMVAQGTYGLILGTCYQLSDIGAG